MPHSEGRTRDECDPPIKMPLLLFIDAHSSAKEFGKLCSAVKLGHVSGNSLITDLRERSSTAGRSALVTQIASAEPFPPRLQHHYLSSSLPHCQCPASLLSKRNISHTYDPNPAHSVRHFCISPWCIFLLWAMAELFRKCLVKTRPTN